MDSNSTHQDDANVISADIRTIERNAEVLLNDFKDIGLAVITGRAKYLEVRHHRDMMANEYNPLPLIHTGCSGSAFV